MPRMKVWSSTQNNWIFADESLPSRDVIIDDEAPSNTNAIWVDTSDNDVDDIAIANVVGLQSALDSKASKIDYTTEEDVNLGIKWIDGKDVWQRVISGTLNQTGSYSPVRYSHNNLGDDIDYVIESCGYMKHVSSNQIKTIPYAEQNWNGNMSLSSVVEYYTDGGYWSLYVIERTENYSFISNNSPYNVVIRFTKKDEEVS